MCRERTALHLFDFSESYGRSVHLVTRSTCMRSTPLVRVGRGQRSLAKRSLDVERPFRSPHGTTPMQVFNPLTGPRSHIGQSRRLRDAAAARALASPRNGGCFRPLSSVFRRLISRNPAAAARCIRARAAGASFRRSARRQRARPARSFATGTNRRELLGGYGSRDGYGVTLRYGVL
jgi:hypothetical protein